MANICLVSCVKSKTKKENKARNIYTSALFEKARNIAESEFDKWYILSAKYGLISPNKTIQPYEQTLNQMGQKERLAWTKDVYKKLKRIVKPDDKITFFAGLNYRENLKRELETLGCEVEFPMEGMSIGNQLKWLSFSKLRRKISQDVEKFYELINSLEKGLSGKKNIRESSGKGDFPNKGVYFFFEPEEKRRFKPDKLRITRVGTHGVSRGSKSSLWQRVKTHIGTNGGGGNHRGSIFRLHIGKSILEKNKLSSKYPSWGVGQTGTKEQKEEEKFIESLVSKYISNLSILWVEIDDKAGPESDRAYIERNSIGLLSFAVPTIDRPSTGWGGNYSVKESIRASGLWNINHVGGGYDPGFLKIFETYVKATKGESGKPKGTISSACSPENIIKSDTDQMQLFLD